MRGLDEVSKRINDPRFKELGDNLFEVMAGTHEIIIIDTSIHMGCAVCQLAKL